jgi:hypothetical protein
MKNLILSLMLAAGLAFAAGAQKLQTMANNANTPAAHSEVARGYLEWAKSLDEKAAKHESNAERLARDAAYNPMKHKWPAMAAAPAERERRLAMQARRAANEARQLAMKHEALAANKPTSAE